MEHRLADLRDAAQGRGAEPLIYVPAVDYDRGGEWAGKTRCARGRSRSRSWGVQDCASRGYKATGFFEVDTGDAKEWTVRLTDPEPPPRNETSATRRT